MPRNEERSSCSCRRGSAPRRELGTGAFTGCPKGREGGTRKSSRPRRGSGPLALSYVGASPNVRVRVRGPLTKQEIGFRKRNHHSCRRGSAPRREIGTGAFTGCPMSGSSQCPFLLHGERCNGREPQHKRENESDMGCGEPSR